MDNKNINPIHEILELAAWEFQNMGLDYIAYIKPDMIDDLPAYGIYAADGEKLAVKKTFKAAAMFAHENALRPIMVH